MLEFVKYIDKGFNFSLYFRSIFFNHLGKPIDLCIFAV